jgi:hypothetical protein
MSQVWAVYGHGAVSGLLVRKSVACWLPLAALLDRAHDDLDHEPDGDQIGDHLPGDHQLACSRPGRSPTVPTWRRLAW